MSSSIKLTNSSGKIVTITNPDTTSADVAVDLLNNAYTIATVDDFGTVPVGYTTVIVKDTDRGGIFVWSASGTANGGTVFAGSSGYWVRQYSGAVNVKWFGASPDNSAVENTIAFTNCFNDTLAENIYVPPLQYSIGEVIVGDRSFSVEQYNATFLLVGDRAGFRFSGQSTGVKISGGYLVGDNTNRDSAVSDAQFGYRFGIESGSNAQRCILKDITVEKTNQGFVFANATGTTTPSKNHKIINCNAVDIRGTVGGIGYGFQFTQANGSTVIGCTAENCGRHGIYFAEGSDYSAVNCIIKEHRITEGTFNTPRAGLDISRSHNVAVSNCVFKHNMVDCMIYNDALGEPGMDSYARNITITGCTFTYSLEQAIFIGYGTGDANNVIENVNINGNTFYTDIADAGVQNTALISYQYGNNVSIVNNNIMTTKLRGISLVANGASAYTTNILVEGNTQIAAGAFSIDNTLLIGTSKCIVRGNSITNTAVADEEFTFPSSTSEENIINPNLLFKRNDGTNSKRIFTATGTASLNVAGCDAITLNPASALKITALTGAYEGQELTLYFNNANTTLSNTNFYLSVTNGTFVSTGRDTLKLVYIQGGWREISRSNND